MIGTQFTLAKSCHYPHERQANEEMWWKVMPNVSPEWEDLMLGARAAARFLPRRCWRDPLGTSSRWRSGCTRGGTCTSDKERSRSHRRGSWNREELVRSSRVHVPSITLCLVPSRFTHSRRLNASVCCMFNTFTELLHNSRALRERPCTFYVSLCICFIIHSIHSVPHTIFLHRSSDPFSHCHLILKSSLLVLCLKLFFICRVKGAAPF